MVAKEKETSTARGADEADGGEAVPASIVGVVADPEESARAAGLRYISDDRPGIRRRRAGKGFTYIGPDGRPVKDPAVLGRIRSLAIPPAWTDVWISPDPRGHIQATGRDDRGRKQYRYHPEWRRVRDETKYGRLIAFAQALPALRERIESDLRRPALDRRKVLATVVRLLETTCIRIGNEEYARLNRSFGLTTLRTRHLKIEGTTLRFKFRGKSGKQHVVHLRDRRLARIVKRISELPGQELFHYVDEEGMACTVSSEDVNAYLREVCGQDFTAKDFRTWAGTVLCMVALRELGPAEKKAHIKRNVVQAIRQVAERLGNTPAICRHSYVHPAILECYTDGTMFAMLEQWQRKQAECHESRAERQVDLGLAPEEQAALYLLTCRGGSQEQEHGEA